MQLFIAILWYILVFLAGPEILNNKKEAIEDTKPKMEAIKKVDLSHKQSRVIAWDDDAPSNPK